MRSELEKALRAVEAAARALSTRVQDAPEQLAADLAAGRGLAWFSELREALAAEALFEQQP